MKIYIDYEKLFENLPKFKNIDDGSGYFDYNCGVRDCMTAIRNTPKVEDVGNEFVQDRNEAFIDAVMNDDFSKFKAYAKKYGVPLPTTKKIMKAGVYKAVQECTDIPQDVKDIAYEKCIALGFSPFLF